MKFLLFSLFVVLGIMFLGCSDIRFSSPYALIESSPDSQIFVYTDADIRVTANGTISDDTTVIVVGVKDAGDGALESILVNTMYRIKEIFEFRQKVYSDWVKHPNKSLAENVN